MNRSNRWLVLTCTKCHIIASGQLQSPADTLPNEYGIARALIHARQNLKGDDVAKPILAIGQAQFEADFVEYLRHDVDRVCIVRAAMEHPVWHDGDTTQEDGTGFRKKIWHFVGNSLNQ